MLILHYQDIETGLILHNITQKRSFIAMNTTHKPKKLLEQDRDVARPQPTHRWLKQYISTNQKVTPLWIFQHGVLYGSV